METKRISELMKLLNAVQKDYFSRLQSVSLLISPDIISKNEPLYEIFRGVVSFTERFTDFMRKDKDSSLHSIEDNLFVEIFVFESLLATMKGLEKDFTNLNEPGFQIKLNLN